MYFQVPEGTTRLNVHGSEFEVNAGIIDVPDLVAGHLMPHLKAHGCKPVVSKVIEVVTEPKPQAARKPRNQAQTVEGSAPPAGDILPPLGTDPVASGEATGS